MKKDKKNSELVSIGELAKISGLRSSTIKYYTEIGILPFKQEEEGLRRHYNKAKATKQLKEIKELQEEKRLTIEEIKEHFKSTK